MMDDGRHDEMDLEDVENYLLGESLLEASRDPKEEKTTKKSKKKVKAKLTPKAKSLLPTALQKFSSSDEAAYESLVKMLETKGELSKVNGYEIFQDYKSGDALQHSVFGLGFVTEKREKNKIHVLFKDRKSLLICNQSKKAKKSATNKTKS
jgi:hypothetical protein